jgi:hypothetical protein
VPSSLHLPSTFRLIARLRSGKEKRREKEERERERERERKRERESNGDRMDD